ncbi:hypothetical protein LWP59_22745 [Amycolatopsis acidiphila]|uniref:Uncharacterized protein n=1 Tax=Amycolatopsis acidiphila TaxID=715473 RepID=A0A558A874_9PSEU|nr:hypothetical protein [Amycolatopsis acidiphila]TVT20459.1 hypothetical protein FNH06_20135 [Amycolatopsis acidiphila]UIJ56977.1 hypothetical protein LWP59_22745 [Amycolatopsis acidiphila]GHG54011.1 hypothetical protein GCM10017788_03310 [Amycolatopsis acidiphila]
MLWHPRAGTVVNSQQDDTQCWASLLPNGNPDARSDLAAEFLIGERAWDGSAQVPGSAPVVVRYGLPDGRIRTELTITQDTVTRSVQGTSALTEQIPLVLRPDDRVAFADGTPVSYNANAAATATGLTIRRGGTTIAISWGSPLAATVTATTVTFLRDAARRLHVLRIPHGGTLTTSIRLR